MPSTSNPASVLDCTASNAAMLLQPEQSLMSLDMFQIDSTQSQGDRGKDFSTVEDQNLLGYQDLEAFNFLDSIEKNVLTDIDWDETGMNVILKDLFTGTTSEETMDLSSLLNSNGDFSSELSMNEQSYDLNILQSISDDKTEYTDLEKYENLLTVPTSSATQNLCEVADLAEIDSSTDSSQHVQEVYIDSTTIQNTAESESNSNESIAGKKYIEMRRKNNIASQRSRKIRKEKNSQMTMKLKTLERENKELLLLAEKLEKERNVLQERLMSIFTKK